MNESYSPISVRLDSGRLLRVDMLLIEARVLPLDDKAYPEAEMPLLAKRSWLGWAEKAWFEPGPIHYKIEDHEVDSPDSFDRLLISTLLYSASIRNKDGFSELLVVTYINWNAAGGIQLALQKALSDLDWDSLAVDRPLHTKSRGLWPADWLCSLVQ